MPKDFAHAKPPAHGRRSASAPRSSRGPFAAGLVLGLAVALLVYLADRGYVSPERLWPDGDQDPSPTASEPEVERPRFDFYTILPEMEVVIPERDSPAPDYRGEAAAGSPAAEPSPDEPPALRPQTEAAGGYIVQAGSFRNAADAESLKASLALLGFQAAVQRVTINRDTYHRVRLGPFATLQDANEARNRLSQNGYQSILLRLKG